MKIDVRQWIRISLINISIVALLGTLMRYKIGFEFPYFDQKFVQHAHSHFAFAAWITHTIMVFMLRFLEKNNPTFSIRPYNFLLTANLICAYGMLISFILDGYNLYSISFSQMSILVFYGFAWRYFLDLRKINHPSVTWFKAALIFGIISSLGTYSLAYMMASKHIIQNIYLGSVYFYLHFQYNGWFLFASIGLLIFSITLKFPDWKPDRRIFLLMCLACPPAYLLSVLWLEFPIWLLVIVALAALSQFSAWILLLKELIGKGRSFFKDIPTHTKFLFALIAIAYSIKLLLQLGSTIPEVSKLAFGFRPIVIAYLHLILLAVISMFLLTYMHAFVAKDIGKNSRISLLVFAAAVYLNEIVLTVQGIASFSYTLVPYVNETLFIIAFIILIASVLMTILMKSINFD